MSGVPPFQSLEEDDVGFHLPDATVVASHGLGRQGGGEIL